MGKINLIALDKANNTPASTMDNLNRKLRIIFECNDGKVSEIKYDYKKIDTTA